MPNGKRFQPGVSGNPRGLAVVPPEERARRKEERRILREAELGRLSISTMAREHAPLAVQTLVEIIRVDPDPAERRLCAVELLNRGFGKPTETVFTAVAGVNAAEMPALSEAMERLRAVFGAPQRVIEHESAST